MSIASNEKRQYRKSAKGRIQPVSSFYLMYFLMCSGVAWCSGWSFIVLKPGLEFSAWGIMFAAMGYRLVVAVGIGRVFLVDVRSATMTIPSSPYLAHMCLKAVRGVDPSDSHSPHLSFSKLGVDGSELHFSTATSLFSFTARRAIPQASSVFSRSSSPCFVHR